MKQLQIYVNDELWTFDVSDIEFQAAISGDKNVIKVAQESERQSMALINKEIQADKPRKPARESAGKPVDATEVNDIRKEAFVWPDEAVLLFLEIYRYKESDFASGLKRNNKIWMEIATEIKKAKYNVTAAQCQNKMSGLKRTYKNISESNKKSGNHLSSWAFYSVMDSIFGEKTWIASVSIASSDGPSPGSSSSILMETLTIDEPKSKKDAWNQFWNRLLQK